MDKRKVIGIYNLVVGSSMVLMWVMFYVWDSIPELETDPYGIAMHLIAEFMTAGLLIASGIVLLKKGAKATLLYGIAYGALLYTVINSSGYFLEPFDMAMTLMFAMLLVSSTVLMGLYVRILKQAR